MAAEWISYAETGHLFPSLYNLRGRAAIAIDASRLVGLADKLHR